MNVLIVTTYKPIPNSSGNQSVALLLAKLFYEAGHKCYSAYQKNNKSNKGLNYIAESICLNNVEAFVQFVKDKNIDLVINNAYRSVKYSYIQVLKNGGCKMISIIHNTPGYLSDRNKMEHLWHAVSKSKNAKIKLIYGLKILLYPLYRRYIKHNEFVKLKMAYDSSDKIVLLNDKHKEKYCRIIKNEDNSKLVIIENPLTFLIDKPDFKKKKNEVLIVARFDDISKRILLALQLWKEIQRFNNNYKLVIVGSGDWEKAYKIYARNNKLNVQFIGKANPLKYYKDAKFFMMTSLYEALPLTLIESLQNGVIPMAFDTFDSANNIIIDGYNGFLIPEGDLNKYIYKFSEMLFESDEVIGNLSNNSFESSLYFSVDNYKTKWNMLLRELFNNQLL